MEKAGSWHVPALLAVLLLFGCATQGAGLRNEVITPHYAFEVPADQGWGIGKSPDSPDKSRMDIVDSARRDGSCVYTIRTFRREIPEKLRTWPIKRIADDFRSVEQRFMEAMAPLSKISYGEFVQGEEAVGGKTFYTMSYTFEKPDTGRNNAYLYLHFPKADANKWFLFILYQEGPLSSESPPCSGKSEFLKVLENLSVTP